VFLRDVGEKTVGIEDIVFLKRYFSVSVDMMLRRLRDLRLISQADHNHLLEEVNKRRRDEAKELAPMSCEPVDAWERISRFWHLARKAGLDELVSMGKLAQWLGLNVVETRKKVQEWQ
jgi:Zn-dependent peptidase ImmA (M78 family)